MWAGIRDVFIKNCDYISFFNDFLGRFIVFTETVHCSNEKFDEPFKKTRL